MSKGHIPLESVRIATPCKASWEHMQGDGKARFCLTCHKQVYNLSGMSRGEAEALINEKEGKLCIHVYQRADGTILTNDCPVGLRMVQRPFKWLVAGAALLLASGIALATGHDPLANSSGQSVKWHPIQRVMDWLMAKRISNTFSGAAGGMAYDISGLSDQKDV